MDFARHVVADLQACPDGGMGRCFCCSLLQNDQSKDWPLQNRPVPHSIRKNYFVAASLARAKKLRYACSVAGGGFPPHSLSVVPFAIQIPVSEG
jgi:hypothetical protein